MINRGGNAMSEQSKEQENNFVPVSERLKKHQPPTVNDMFHEIENDLKNEVDEIKDKYEKNEE